MATVERVPMTLDPSRSAATVSVAPLGDWLQLMKPRVVTLVVFTGLIGLLIAPGHLHPVLAVIALLCIAIAAGAAGAINMWYERDIDALMRRTRNRPLPAGRIEPGEALGFAVVLGGGSVVVMFLATNAVAAGLLVASIGFYVFVYTIWLKRRTPQNIVIGGAAGAFPPVIGWAAVTGSVDALPLLLFAIIFCWTPPHFWSLALFANSDYERAGVPMLPAVAGARETRRQILIYTVALAALSLAPWFAGLAGLVYAVAAAALGAGFVWHAWRVWTDQADRSGASGLSDAPAKLSFRYSIAYLFALFTAVAVDRLIGT
jgi:protoheme IX farnesyltransferase